MSAPLALILATLLALPSAVFAQAEEEVVNAIRGRLDAVRRNDTAAWSKFVAEDMMAPLEGAVRSKQGWIRQHQSWPREVTYWYGPLEDLKVRIDADTAIVTFHARQFTQIGGQTTSVHKWQIEMHLCRDGRWQLLGVADGLIPPEPTGDRLLEHLGGGDAAEWLPESATTFFVPGEATGGDSSRIIFVRDASGRVTHYIYRALGGTDRIVRKVK
jgi:hypothetical protein